MKAIRSFSVCTQDHLLLSRLQWPPAALSAALVPDVKSRCNHRDKKRNSCFHVHGESDDSVLTSLGGKSLKG